jgi:hypothetical protein
MRLSPLCFAVAALAAAVPTDAHAVLWEPGRARWHASNQVALAGTGAAIFGPLVAGTGALVAGGVIPLPGGSTSSADTVGQILLYSGVGVAMIGPPLMIGGGLAGRHQVVLEGGHASIAPLVVATALYPLAGACAGLWLGAGQAWALAPGAALFVGSAGFAFAGLVLERRAWTEVSGAALHPWVSPTDGGFVAGVTVRGARPD